MGENFRSAIQGIRSHKLRSFLTMLGIIIGIASIIAIVSTIKGTNEQILQDLIGAGNNSVTVALKQGDNDWFPEMGDPGVPPVSEGQKEAIRAIEHVEDVSFYRSRGYAESVRHNDASLPQGRLLGIDLHYLNTTGQYVYEGRKFIDADFKNGKKVILLDQVAASLLFPNQRAIGEIVEIYGEPFTVIGLVKRKDNFQPKIESLNDYYTYMQDLYGTVLIPEESWPILFQYDEPQNCVLRADSTKHMSQIGKAAEEILNATTTGEDFRYQAQDLVEKAKNQQQLSASTNNMLIWIASIALLVGGIGVMNIMLVSVTERTGEIGLKKALGAKKRKILAQFLTESALLTSIGGILGVIGGIILSIVISKMAEVPVAISIPAILIGVGFSAMIGIVFGILPSIKAANLNPIDALRRE